MMTSLLALNALNFFMADVRDGFGPFLGVLLQGKGWSAAEIGLVMTIGGYAGMIATTPLGALVDATRAKRGLMIASALAIIAASMVILGVPAFPAISTAQAINGIAGAAVGPAIAGLTLGLVKQAGFAHQLGRNEAFNHAGNVTAALLGGAFGYLFGLTAVFFVMTGMAVGSICAALVIDPRHIDHAAARGLAGMAGKILRRGKKLHFFVEVNLLQQGVSVKWKPTRGVKQVGALGADIRQPRIGYGTTFGCRERTRVIERKRDVSTRWI